MKKITLLFIMICLNAIYSSAQKQKVQTAWNYYREPFQEYDKAKQSIDEAIQDPSTATSTKAWYYRGLIYQALFKDKKYGALCDNCLITAYESYMKVNEIDPKNEWVDEIKIFRVPVLVDSLFRDGISKFNLKDYNSALNIFENVHKMIPQDTIVILNCALSADRAHNKEKAKIYYSKLIELRYPDDKIYLNLSNIYKSEKDNENAMKYVKTGRQLYPDSVNLMFAEINLLLAGGKNEEAAAALSGATKKDPNNPNLYLALGSSYDNLANPKGEDGKDLPKPAKYNDYITQAEASYKSGLAIAPDNYELNFNLGALYFNQAAEMANQANSLKSNEEFNKAKLRFEQKFKDAEPYLEKALEKNPKVTDDDKSIYQSTLTSLKQLYVRTNETEKYNKVKALLDQK